MVTARTPDGKKPLIERSDQVYSNILDGTAESQEPSFPMRVAYDKAMTEVSKVVIPPTELAGGRVLGEAPEHFSVPIPAQVEGTRRAMTRTIL